MKIVLADVEREPLLKAEAELSESGAQVLAVETDVSKGVDLERLAEETISTFGGVHLLFNNAGVALGGRIWENAKDDWDWMAMCEVNAMENEYTPIGWLETYNMEPSETRGITLELDEGYSVEDIQFLDFTAYWFEGGWYMESVPYDDSDPFEWTLIPE